MNRRWAISISMPFNAFASYCDKAKLRPREASGTRRAMLRYPHEQGSIVMSSVRQNARLATFLSILIAVLSTPANSQQAATTWVLQKGQNMPSRPAQTPHLRMDGEKLTGSTGCNSFTAKMSQRVDNGVSIERIALTRMLCAPEQNKIEVALVRALEETQFIETKGEKLSFLSAERQPLLVWNAR